jgi:hypothetical protein
MWENQDPPKDPGPGLKLVRRVESGPAAASCPGDYGRGVLTINNIWDSGDQV